MTIAPSFDNHRFNDQQAAVGVYRDVLEPPVSKCDVTYFLNKLALNHGSRTGGERVAAINTAGRQRRESPKISDRTL